MKRGLSLFALLITVAFSLSAQTASDAAELTRLLNEFLAGAGRGDAAVHDRFWANDLIDTRSAGVRTNKEELMKGVRSSPAPKPGDPVTVYTAEDIQIHQYGNAAVVAFKLVISTTKAGGTKTVGNNLNTGTFIKRKGIWRSVAWQSTIVPKPDSTAKNNSQDAAAPASTDGARVYLKGAKGGCYYLVAGGKKMYVSHDLCK